MIDTLYYLAPLIPYFDSFVLWSERDEPLTYKIKMNDMWYDLRTEDVEQLYIPLSEALSRALEDDIRLKPAPLRELFLASQHYILNHELNESDN